MREVLATMNGRLNWHPGFLQCLMGMPNTPTDLLKCCSTAIEAAMDDPLFLPSITAMCKGKGNAGILTQTNRIEWAYPLEAGLVTDDVAEMRNASESLKRQQRGQRGATDTVTEGAAIPGPAIVGADVGAAAGAAAQQAAAGTGNIAVGAVSRASAVARGMGMGSDSTDSTVAASSVVLGAARRRVVAPPAASESPRVVGRPIACPVASEVSFTSMLASTLHHHIRNKFVDIEVLHQFNVLGSIPDIVLVSSPELSPATPRGACDPASVEREGVPKLPFAFIEVGSDPFPSKVNQMFLYALKNLVTLVDGHTRLRNPCQLGLHIESPRQTRAGKSQLSLQWTLLGYCITRPPITTPTPTRAVIADVVLGSGNLSNLGWALEMLVLCCLHCGWDYSPIALDWPSNVFLTTKKVFKVYRNGTKRKPNIQLFQSISGVEAELITVGNPQPTCQILQYPFQQGSHTASSVQQAQTIARQLENLHRLGFVHGDIRGGNLIFGDKSVIIDFDFASPRGSAYPNGYTTEGLGDAERHPAAKNLDAIMDPSHDIFSLHSILKQYACSEEASQDQWTTALAALDRDSQPLSEFINSCRHILQCALIRVVPTNSHGVDSSSPVKGAGTGSPPRAAPAPTSDGASKATSSNDASKAASTGPPPQLLRTSSSKAASESGASRAPSRASESGASRAPSRASESGASRAPSRASEAPSVPSQSRASMADGMKEGMENLAITC